MPSASAPLLSMTRPRQAHRRLRLAVFTALAVCGSATLVHAAPPPPPPVSDGSSGSFDGQFGNGINRNNFPLLNFNTDNGAVGTCVSGGGCFTVFTVPFKTIAYNGQTLHAFEFTDMTVEATVKLTIVGSTPAVFLAVQDISFAGQFVFLNGGGAAGESALIHANHVGGKGGGFGGGGGGAGMGGPVLACNGSFQGRVYAGSGGGGGNVVAGGAGSAGYVSPGTSSPPPTPLPGGAGGRHGRAPYSRLQGGGGGGAGGDETSGGGNFAIPGEPGGGSALFSTKASVSIASTGVIDASGSGPSVADSGLAGASGGGAGGDVWFFAGTAFSNAGKVSVAGGAGGVGLLNDCTGNSGIGTQGGMGSGGRLLIRAPKINNAGRLDALGGGASQAHAGRIDLLGPTGHRGTITGRAVVVRFR